MSVYLSETTFHGRIVTKCEFSHSYDIEVIEIIGASSGKNGTWPVRARLARNLNEVKKENFE